MSKPKRYLITAALPYANGPLHIGHVAGAYLPSDIYVRYLKAKGEDVVFVCGSDEHGAAITIKALKENTTPQHIIDEFHTLNKKAFEDFGIDFDIYHRTSSDLHHETAQEFFLDLYHHEKFIEKTSEQFYDEKHDQFLADRYVTGTCPKCQNANAYGDQCEKCGSSLNPTDLINPKSTLSGETPILKTTKHWYFPLDAYEHWLKQWILEEHKDWKTNVYGQCKSWLDGGLGPRAMTRDLSWGVQVPLKDAEGKVLYVWLDAPIGYISATKQWAKDNNKHWEDYWKKEDTQLVHFIGKDNIVFHCIIFPSLLKANSSHFILPENVPANEFLNLEGGKISTSRNHAIWLHEYVQDFPNQTDVLRYVLCSIAPETKDSEFTWSDFQARNNNELVAILGNFVNRCVVLTQKYYNEKIPEIKSFQDREREVLGRLEELKFKIEKAIENYRFREAQMELMNIARLGNKYLADLEPWKLIKTDPDQVKEIMVCANLIVANLAILAWPFLPQTAAKLAEAYKIDLKWGNACSPSLLNTLNGVSKLDLLFTKIEDVTVQYQVNKLKKPQTPKNTEHMAQKESISFNDFTKLDIRVGKIIAAEKVKKADKLLELKVDTGLDIRTVVSGIAEHYAPEEVVGKKVTVLLNLEPRKIRGIESQGMILMAEDKNGLQFMQPSSDAEIGSLVS